ncbi:MAG: hypothetical protein ACREJB_14210 [Planctomycetaceae bacterium]
MQLTAVRGVVFGVAVGLLSVAPAAADDGQSADNWTIQIRPLQQAFAKVDQPPTDAPVIRPHAQPVYLTAFQEEAPSPMPPVPPEDVPAEQPPAETGDAAPGAGDYLPAGLPQFDPVQVRQAYMAVYFGIPFLRTEYEANPAYRHEATMEILFGHLRPTVIHKTQPGVVVRPYDPYGFVKPGIPFETDAYNLNYNFFFRRRSIYRAY